MDLFFFNIINNLALKSNILDWIFIFFAEYSGYFLIFFLFLFLFKDFRKYKFLPVSALLAGFFARYGIVEIVRFLFHRARPFVENDVSVLIEHASTSSFPSGHTSFFFALSTIVFLYNKKAGYIFFTISFLIGFSRIVSGIHWPSDILIGALIGILIGWLVGKIFSKKIPHN